MFVIMGWACAERRFRPLGLASPVFSSDESPYSATLSAGRVGKSNCVASLHPGDWASVLSVVNCTSVQGTGLGLR